MIVSVSLSLFDLSTSTFTIYVLHLILSLHSSIPVFGKERTCYCLLFSFNGEMHLTLFNLYDKVEQIRVMGPPMDATNLWGFQPTSMKGYVPKSQLHKSYSNYWLKHSLGRDQFHWHNLWFNPTNELLSWVIFKLVTDHGFKLRSKSLPWLKVGPASTDLNQPYNKVEFIISSLVWLSHWLLFYPPSGTTIMWLTLDWHNMWIKELQMVCT